MFIFQQLVSLCLLQNITINNRRFPMSFDNEYKDLPLGFSLALAQDLNALDHFASLNDTKQQKVIDKAKQIKSKEEMRNYVQDIKNF